MMFKKLALAATITLSTAVAAFAGNLDKKTEEMFAPTVQLNSNCSGVIFHSDRDKVSGDVETYVLTAKHCVKGNKYDVSAVQVHSYNDDNRKTIETRYISDVIGRYYAADLAVLKLRDTETLVENTAAIMDADSYDLEFGTDVHSVGFPMGLSMTYTKGTLGYVEEIPQLKKLSKSGQFYRATPETIGGNSGGPLFAEVDGKYQVIGITSASWSVPGGHMNYFTPIEEINEYLERVRKIFDTEYKFYGEKDEDTEE